MRQKVIGRMGSLLFKIQKLAPRLESYQSWSCTGVVCRIAVGKNASGHLGLGSRHVPGNGAVLGGVLPHLIEWNNSDGSNELMVFPAYQLSNVMIVEFDQVSTNSRGVTPCTVEIWNTMTFKK
jgi:hypothetical protein